jgi:hypothetical protein
MLFRQEAVGTASQLQSVHAELNEKATEYSQPLPTGCCSRPWQPWQ